MVHKKRQNILLIVLVITLILVLLFMLAAWLLAKPAVMDQLVGRIFGGEDMIGK